MTTDSDIRFAIAGLGGHARVLADAIDRADGAVLTSAASTSRKRADEFCLPRGIAGFDSYHGLLESSLADVLIIATPNDLHCDLAVDALKSGLEVLCEKPMALTADDAERMLEASRRSGRPLYVGYYLRFLEALVRMRDIVMSGAIGIPFDLRLQRSSQHTPGNLREWRQDLHRAGAGVLCDVAVHLVDLVTFLTGQEIVAVSATARPARGTGVPDDQIALVLSLENGGIATVNATRGVQGGENDIHVHGSSGSVCSGPLRWVEQHALTVTTEDDSWTESATAGAPYAAEIEGVVARHRGGASVVADSRDGLRGVRVLTAAMRSLETERTEPVPEAAS